MAHLLRKKIKNKIDHATDHGDLLKINRAVYPIHDLKNELQQRTLEMKDQDVQNIAFMILDITDLSPWKGKTQLFHDGFCHV